MLTPDQKGSIAESAIAYAAIRLGIGVSRPLAPQRYDLIFDVGPTLLRVQCKWVVRRHDIVVVPCRSCRRGPNGFIRRSYSGKEIDAIAAYCAELDRCYFLPLDRFAARSVIQLRLSPTRNSQRLGVNWADAYAFDATLEALLGP
jgi:hypothetical protein